MTVPFVDEESHLVYTEPVLGLFTGTLVLPPRGGGGVIKEGRLVMVQGRS